MRGGGRLKIMCEGASPWCTYFGNGWKAAASHAYTQLYFPFFLSLPFFLWHFFFFFFFGGDCPHRPPPPPGYRGTCGLPPPPIKFNQGCVFSKLLFCLSLNPHGVTPPLPAPPPPPSFCSSCHYCSLLRHTFIFTQ